MTNVRLVPAADDDLAWTPRGEHAEALRRDLLRVVAAAIDAAAPAPLVVRALTDEPLEAERIIVTAAGKAAVPMAAAALGVLAGAELRGVVVAPEPTGSASGAPGPDMQPLELLHGGHPLPTASSAAAGRRVAELMSASQPDEVVLLLLSGGASALLALPAGDLSIEDIAATTSLLLRSGADIHQLNTVRRHLDALKGGRLAALAQPARVRALALSDVVGDALAAIASGPVSPDTTTCADAIAVLHDLGAWAGTPERVRRHLERGARGEYADTLAPGDPAFDGVDTRIIGNNSLALRGAADAAQAAGYAPIIVDAPVSGEARVAGSEFGRHVRELATSSSARPRIALLAGGETTVHVTGAGRGGRNQELTLAAALEISGIPRVLVASFGTDGIDGTTSVAGAVADGESVGRAAGRGSLARNHLEDNDSFAFFGGLHDLILTGPTGTNVLDIQVALIDRT
jgi:glycerate-2-kinase